jgi:hypothetical protein
VGLAKYAEEIRNRVFRTADIGDDVTHASILASRAKPVSRTPKKLASKLLRKISVAKKAGVPAVKAVSHQQALAGRDREIRRLTAALVGLQAVAEFHKRRCEELERALRNGGRTKLSIRQ